MYDYLIVGAGLYGAVFAQQAKKHGKSVLVIDRRDHIAGNVYTKPVEGIQVHQYGAHIFHTSDTDVWNYVNGFAEFNRFTNSPVANFKGMSWDKWLRRRFRMYIWKQWKKPRSKVANLRKLGIPADKAYQWGNSRLGYWRMAGSPALTRSITNERLAAAGYFSILNYYESLHLCG